MRIKFLIFGSALIILAGIALSLPGGGDRSSDEARSLPHSSFPIEVIDAVGERIIVEAPPKRIVSLSPSLTEALFLLGGGDLLVGRSRYCVSPEEAQEIESVGGVTDPNIEKLGMLDPDLVFGITMGLRHEVAERMRQVGLTPMYFQQRSLDDIRDDVRLLSRIIGRPETGEAWADDADRRRETIRNEMAEFWDDQQPRALIFYYNPGGIFSAGSGSWPGSMLETLGVENIANQLNSAWPRLSTEWIIRSNPEVIIYAPTSANDTEMAREHAAEIRDNPVWKDIHAVRENNIVVTDHGDLVNSGPSAYTALERLGKILRETYSHGEDN